MRTKRIYTLLLIMILSNTFYANAEYSDYATNKYSVIPPSPEVSSMMKYIDVPVSYFTGQPQIEIPIYTLTEGTLSVPISLSYRGGGIKQNELPGIISKGWTLMAGMTISRTVHGLPDETNLNSGTPKWIRGLFNLSSEDKSLRNTIKNRTGSSEPQTLNTNVVISYNNCSDYESGYVDFANDIYKFYGQGMSGTFIFDENRQMTISTSSPIQFKSEQWKSYDYEIEDKDLTVYTFGTAGVETTYTPINADLYNVNVEFEENMDKLSYTSAWHITKMTSLYGDVINFEYSAPIYRNNYLGPVQYYSYVNGGSWCYLNDRTSLTAMSNKYYERSLLSIKSKSATIRFHYNTTNTQLESISIHKNDENTTELYRYTIHRDAYGNMTKICQTANNNDTIDIYGFSYNSKTCTDSKAIDHWGYCNGHSENETILPEVKGLEHLPYDKANRKPSESATKQGVLTQIKYPMGGTTTLTWEQHDYSYIKKNNNYIQPTTQTVTTNETIQLRGTQIKQRLNTGTYTMKNGESFSINLSTYLDPLMSGASTFQLEFGSEYESSSHTEPYPRLEIYKNGTLYKKYYIDKNNSKSLISISTENATYQFKLINPRSFTGMSDTDINNFWGANPATSYENYGYINIIKRSTNTIEESVIYQWGGLRIAGITSNPTDGMQVIKNYSYRKKMNNLTYSTGVIHFLPEYTYQSSTYYTEPGGYAFANIYNVGSNGIPMSTAGESSIEYSEVWESYSGDIKGEIGYFYETQSNYSDVENCLYSGYVPTGLKTLTSYAYKRGHLNEKHYMGFFEESDRNKILYKKELYDYNILEKNMNNTIFTGPLHTLCDYSNISYSDGKGDVLHKHYTINKYTLIPYNKRIKNETIWEKQNITGGEIESENTISYTYYGDGYSSKPWNSFVRTQSYRNSRGQLVTKYYTYYKKGNIPLDLKELEITVINNVVVSAKRYVYNSSHRLSKTYGGCKGLNFSSNFTIPMSITESATYPSIDKEEYSYEYDLQGNIVQISYGGKVLASFLWGYMGKHPIAEVQGICYADLLNIVNDNNLYSEENYVNDSNLQSLFSKLRTDTRLSGKNVMTYTYHWLFCMATSTDSREIKNTYLLDGFGRLSGVKDHNGYYISKYDYNYKGL